jgi:glycerate kinase
MKIVIACDSFKSSASSREVSNSLAEGILTVIPECEIEICAIGDGGEGTLDALLHAGFQSFEYQVTGPVGNPVTARIAVRDDIALVEMAEASGLSQLPAKELAPLTATSFGTGELIAKALDRGVTTIILAVGGTATTDGGAGALQALGAQLLNSAGESIARGGAALENLVTIDLTNLDARIATTRFVLASDVTNPLLGANGAAHVFGPQKGASTGDVELLEKSLAHFSHVIGSTYANSPGAGAAGGMGFMAFTFLSAMQRSGIEIVLELINFKQSLIGADLVITGEGKFDSQSLGGKAPMGVLAAAGAVPTFMVCGQADLSAKTEFKEVYALTDIEADIQKCIADPAPLLVRVGQAIAKNFLLN